MAVARDFGRSRGRSAAIPTWCCAFALQAGSTGKPFPKLRHEVARGSCLLCAYEIELISAACRTAKGMALLSLALLAVVVVVAQFERNDDDKTYQHAYGIKPEFMGWTAGFCEKFEHSDDRCPRDRRYRRREHGQGGFLGLAEIPTDNSTNQKPQTGGPGRYNPIRHIAPARPARNLRCTLL